VAEKSSKIEKSGENEIVRYREIEYGQAIPSYQQQHRPVR